MQRQRAAAALTVDILHVEHMPMGWELISQGCMGLQGWKGERLKITKKKHLTYRTIVHQYFIYLFGRIPPSLLPLPALSDLFIMHLCHRNNALVCMYNLCWKHRYKNMHELMSVDCMLHGDRNMKEL